MRCKDNPIFHDKPIIVGSADHHFLITDEIKEIGITADIILEPSARNSSAAITAACLFAQDRADDAVVLILAADHYIPDDVAFSENVAQAMRDAKDGHLVTFGIKPTHPATGYGYISPGAKLRHALKVEKFIEKPDAKTAQKYLNNGYLWNSGNFLFQAKSFCNEMQKLEPEILARVSASVELGSTDQGFFRLEDQNFSKAKAISVDHAIMERSNKTAVLPVDYEWLDIGNWAALANILPNDKQGNVVKGDVELLQGSNNLVYSEDKLTTVVGMHNTVVVTTRDAVLVAPKNQVEKIKDLVNLLEEKQHSTANASTQNSHPWGNSKQLDDGPRFQVRRIAVNPDGVLSMQKHLHGGQHWIVVEGKAEVTINDKVQTLEINQSIYMPHGAVYRVENRQSDTLVLIEIQTGNDI